MDARGRSAGPDSDLEKGRLEDHGQGHSVAFAMTRRLPSIFVILVACSGRGSAPPPQAAPPRTEFVLDQLPVRVTFTEPNGLARGDDGCEASSPPWRPEMGAAVVAFITSDQLAKGKRVRHVAIGKIAEESVGLS